MKGGGGNLAVIKSEDLPYYYYIKKCEISKIDVIKHEGPLF